MSSEEPRTNGTQHPVEEVPHHPLWARMGLVVIVLIFGIGAMAGLSALRQEPESSQPPEHRLAAKAFQAMPQNVQTEISGFGTARPIRTVAISAEVSGRIESVHPNLDVGNVIPAGEELFTIDPHDYKQALEQAEAEVERLEAELDRLGRAQVNDERQLKIANEMEEFSRNEYDRIKDLVAQGGVESKSRLDTAALSLNRQIQEVVRLENSLAMYPFQERQTKAQLRRAVAQKENAARNLERSHVTVPFNARIVSQSIEKDQYVMPGQQALVLADDSALEIPASLDSRDVSGWLGLEIAPDDAHWFGDVPDREVEVRWNDDARGEVHTGRLARVEKFNPQTRTFTVVVRVDKRSDAELAFPLADGMFCSLTIPGIEVKNVYVVPREVVDYDGTLLLANDGHLETHKVHVLRYQGDYALVDKGLKEGDIVLTTRPPRVIDGLAVDVELQEAPAL
ncbi:biotin/lipoyl-binding protein [bacterium]|nr:biotin/lipoyl-binding protein [bacterium]